jgi:hypothetical protein
MAACLMIAEIRSGRSDINPFIASSWGGAQPLRRK